MQAALARAGGQLAASLQAGTFAPAAFSAHWQGLGFARATDGAGTPADDYLDGLFHISRLEADDARVEGATLNLASRAERVADFLAVTQPRAADVVFDLGSGSGKLALTVGASVEARVMGVEVVPGYVAHARRSAAVMGRGNVGFTQADVRDVDLSAGTIFYLYHPFHGAVARGVAQRLGRLARRAPVTLYVAGPALDFGEHFTAQVDAGALTLRERRGEFGEVLVLCSRA